MTKRRFVHRILTAVVGAGLICLVTSLGAWPLGLALLLVGLVTQGEVYRLYKYCGKEAWYFAGLVLGAMLCMRSLIPGILPAIVLNVILILGWASVKRPEDVLERLRVTLLGAVYPMAMLAFLIDIRLDAMHLGPAQAVYTTLAVFILIWATDTAAYLVGSTIGRHEFAPGVSPSKTVEGAIGGVVGALLVGVALELSIVSFIGRVEVLGLALLCSLATQGGDLYASLLKRRARVKDSGSILPGHGGLLDRFDGAIVASPVAYFYLLAIGVLSRS